MNCEIPLALHVILWSLTLALVILVAGLGAIAWFMFVDEVHECRVKRSKQNTEQPAKVPDELTNELISCLRKAANQAELMSLHKALSLLADHHEREAKS